MLKKDSSTKEWDMSNTAFIRDTTAKHVSVKGQNVVKTCQSGSFKFFKYQDVQDEVEEPMQKWQTKNSSQRL